MKLRLAILYIFYINPLAGYKILLFPSGIESHQLYFSRFGDELLKHGHHVTILIGKRTPLVPDLKRTNMEIKTFHMDSDSKLEGPTAQFIFHQYAFASSAMERWGITKAGLELFEEEAMQVFKDVKTVENLNSKNYDFVLVDLPQAMLLPYKLSLPFGIIGLDAPHLLRKIPYFPSYVPLFTSGYSDQMTLGRRFFNFIHFAMFDLSLMFMYSDNDLSQQVAPELPPVSVGELYNKASLFFKYNDLGFETPRPGMPDIIPAGHIFVRPPKLLPSAIEEVLLKSKGTILVSSGSLAKRFPEEVVTKLLRVFSTLPHDVIFKHDTKLMTDISDKIHVLKRIPQNDLLAHQNLELFISDCGFHSVMESIYNEVPLICLPMGPDQYSNAAFINSRGYGKQLAISTFTKSQLQDSIEDILSDKTYVANLRKTGQIIRDMQQNNISNPAFWINHVIKFGDTHLRVQAHNMPVYQYLMLDVIGLLVFFAFSICTIIYPILKKCCGVYRWSCLEYKDIGRIN